MIVWNWSGALIEKEIIYLKIKLKLIVCLPSGPGIWTYNPRLSAWKRSLFTKNYFSLTKLTMNICPSIVVNVSNWRFQSSLFFSQNKNKLFTFPSSQDNIVRHFCDPFCGCVRHRIANWRCWFVASRYSQLQRRCHRLNLWVPRRNFVLMARSEFYVQDMNCHSLLESEDLSIA